MGGGVQDVTKGLLPNAEALTLGEVLRAIAERSPDAIALQWGDEATTYAQLDAQVACIARGLVRIGVTPGEVIGLLLGKRPEMVVLFLAAARIGAIVAPINHKLPLVKIKGQLKKVGIRRALIGPGYFELAASLSDVLDLKDSVFCLGSFAPWAYTFEELLRFKSGEIAHTPKSSDVVYLNFTSGSTGRPKGAVTTHANIQANAVSSVTALAMKSDAIFLGLFTSFSHPHELFHRTLNLGATAVLLNTYNPRIIAQAVARYRVSWMMAVPSLYEMMMRRDLSGLDLTSLRLLEAGGAYVSCEERSVFEAFFGVEFAPVWGSTETTGVALAVFPGDACPDGAVGRPCPGYEFQLLDAKSNPLPDGKVGRLVVRGPGVIASYYHMPSESRRRRIGDWYCTGDLMVRDAAGFYHFKSRRSEMLKVGGLRVYPLEVELALSAHLDVQNVVVVGAHDRVRGEVPRAIVTLNAGSTCSVQDLRAHCLKVLAGYKVPRFIEIWPELPHLPNGKVDRRAVADPQES